MKKQSSEIDQGLPFSDEAESGLISCLLQNESLLAEVVVEGDDLFYIPANKALIGEMAYLRSESTPIDLVTLTARLYENKTLDIVGGASRVSELLSFVPTTSYYAHYLSILRQKRSRRRMILCCDESRDEAFNSTEEINVLLARYYQRTRELIKENSVEAKDKCIDQAVEEWMNEYQEIIKGNAKSYKPTRWNSFNRLVGIRPGYYVVSGPPKSGKSCVGTNIMVDACIKDEKPIAGRIFNYELSVHETLNRIIADVKDIHSGYLFQPEVCKPTREVMRDITEAISIIRKSKLEIISRPIQLEEAVEKLRIVHADEGNVIAFVDYLQIAPDPLGKRKEGNREQDVASNSKTLRSASKELNIPIYAGSQVNKNGTTRESDAPIQDADAVFRVEDKGVRVVAGRNVATGELLPLKMDAGYFRFKEQYSTDIPD